MASIRRTYSPCFLCPFFPQPRSNSVRWYRTPIASTSLLCLPHRQARFGNHKYSRASGREAAAEASALMREEDLTTRAHTSNRSARLDGNVCDSQPVAGPASPQAYQYRLRTGHFDDLADLLLMPYAVAPMRVLSDVLREVMRLREHLLAEPDDANALLVLTRLTMAFSDPLAVQFLLSRAAGDISEAVKDASAVGDRPSERALREALNDLKNFFAQLREWRECHAQSSNRDTALGNAAEVQRLLLWDIPDVVMGALWHGLLEMCSVTGASSIAVESLHALAELSDRVERVGANHSTFSSTSQRESCESADSDPSTAKERGETGEEADFTLDGVVLAVEDEARRTFIPVAAIDHIHAMESCAAAREFDVAHALLRRFLLHAKNGVFAVTAADITSALVALSHCCANAADFAQLQELLVQSEAAHTVPVSVALYTAMIDAVSRAAENPQRMSIALALYRRLLDGGLAPSADTYAALIACCASTREPTHAFAFYHEALQRCGAGALTPNVYTNLLLAYARAGYGADARQTLEVLIEAGAPLTRAAFHAVMAAAVTPRDAHEVLELMQSTYGISPTPQSYAYRVAAEAKNPAGVHTLLNLFDCHELALRSVLNGTLDSPHDGLQLSDGAPAHAVGSGAGHSALCSGTGAALLEERLLAQCPSYPAALEAALLRLRVDPAMDPRIVPYLRPLLRVAQRRMLAFTGMAPQVPTRVPAGAAVAVLAADVLANLDEWFVPFAAYYSVVVIPHSSLVALRRGGGRRVDGVFAKAPQPLLDDPAWQASGNEQEAMTANRQKFLQRFLQRYHEVIHLVSAEEEFAMSRDCDRYGISVKKTFARSAAVAMNLARRDVTCGTRVYAEQNCNVVLVSANFEQCGRYVVDLKRELQHDTSSALAEGLRRVWYHNPRTSPDWRPPQVTVAELVKGNATGE